MTVNGPPLPSFPRVTRQHLAIGAAGLVVALVALFSVARWAGEAHRAALDAAQVAVAAPGTPVSGLPTVRAADLPAQVREVLALIDKGGPFPYSRDGAVFGNSEGHLPQRVSGYYHEYTVPTPGSRDRGTWRLVTGARGDVYYTDDHYDSFRQVLR